jgi:hypothetical protein
MVRECFGQQQVTCQISSIAAVSETPMASWSVDWGYEQVIFLPYWINIIHSQ